MLEDERYLNIEKSNLSFEIVFQRNNRIVDYIAGAEWR